MPQDQIFDAEDLEYDPKSQIPSPPRKRIKSESKQSENKTNTDEEMNNDIAIKQEEKESSSWDIDNPYLAATKLPAKSEWNQLRGVAVERTKDG